MLGFAGRKLDEPPSGAAAARILPSDLYLDAGVSSVKKIDALEYFGQLSPRGPLARITSSLVRA